VPNDPAQTSSDGAKLFFPACGLCGFVGVAAGAFGAHGLQGQFDSQALDWWQTGTFYLLTHTVAALAIAATFTRVTPSTRWARVAAYCFLIGGLIFSMTLYAMALGAPRWLGAVTPVGGLILLVGWASVLLTGLKARR